MEITKEDVEYLEETFYVPIPAVKPENRSGVIEFKMAYKLYKETIETLHDVWNLIDKENLSEEVKARVNKLLMKCPSLGEEL